MKIFICFAVIALTSTIRCFAGITSSPGLQKRAIGDNCIFRWTISGSIDGFNISNETTGNSAILRDGTSFTYNSDNGDIILIIWNITLSDAGNYRLITNGQSPDVDNSTWLFVYGYPDYPNTSIYVTSGSNPANEGDTVELSCNITSNSLPEEFRPKTYHCLWSNWKFDVQQNLSAGPDVRYNGYLASGYSIKNDGRTLVIDSARFPDDYFIPIQVFEDGSPLRSIEAWYTLDIKYRPRVMSSSPPTRRLTANVSTEVLLEFYHKANPTPTSWTNWSFTNTAGIQQNLPLQSLEHYTLNYSRLEFNLTSSDYGNYSVTLTNTQGSTTVNFEVLSGGPPATPSNPELFYISDFAISVDVTLSRPIDIPETVFVRLTSQDTGIEIDIQNKSFSPNNYYYNYSFNTVFQKNIQPSTSYEIRVSSINVFGRSGVATLPVRTRNTPKLNVSPNTISINGSQATINFKLIGDNLENITRINAICCSSQTGPCVESLFQGTAVPNQIVMNDIPSGTDYLFDFTVYCGVYGRYSYLSAMAKCIQVSRNESYRNEETTWMQLVSPSNQASDEGAGCQEDNKSLLTAVIVLAVLLGITVLMLIGICITRLCMKFRPNNENYYETKIRPTVSVCDSRSPGIDVRPDSTGSDEFYENLETQNRQDHE